MDFSFNLNNFFKQEITRINYSLLPENFTGDRRTYRFCTEAVSLILDEMGIASAKAQGLLKPITSSDKLRNSEHSVYLLLDLEGNNQNGSVIGMLKMGKKRLYMFDRIGHCHEVVPLCVLDFYVHESKQRMGCGKKLFEYMLNEEKVEPEKLAIDRPSDKFLFFLRKHYGLTNIVRQNNNYVVFEGFFNSLDDSANSRSRKQSSSPDYSPFSVGKRDVTYNGRHTAHKPEATVGKIIHSSPVL
ncbi:hypothetical protein O3M35_002817 [Rhynocoris fuscipes]|uniref:Alpha-tubulin N-acetyltransferase n=1 Tax=Rhynocoris fuscipes TaxID=488301 RepID=A0AAW1CN70_9HEMI